MFRWPIYLAPFSANLPGVLDLPRRYRIRLSSARICVSAWHAASLLRGDSRPVVVRDEQLPSRNLSAAHRNGFCARSKSFRYEPLALDAQPRVLLLSLRGGPRNCGRHPSRSGGSWDHCTAALCRVCGLTLALRQHLPHRGRGAVRLLRVWRVRLSQARSHSDVAMDCGALL